VLLPESDLHVAVDTSLVVMLPNSLAAATVHIRRHTARVDIGLLLAAAAAAGAVGGALLSLALPETVLGFVLSGYVLLMSGREWLRLARSRRTGRPQPGGDRYTRGSRQAARVQRRAWYCIESCEKPKRSGPSTG
jgi:uncharacterized membrane protein YfcA